MTNIEQVGLETVSEDEIEMKWRDLALQFDGHRIEAMEIIRAMLRGGYEQYAKDFLARPPLSGEAVLASRLAIQAPDGWQGMESAPKDGTEVLLWCGQPVCGYYSGDALDPERTAEGWVTDISWPDITEPKKWLPIPSFNSEAERIIREYGRETPVDDLALVLFQAWCSAEPNSGPAKYPTSFLATFADMARAAIKWFPAAPNLGATK